MSLLKGSLSFKRFLAMGPVPDEDHLLEVFYKERFRPFEDGTEEERSGFCDWRNPLLAPDPNHCSIGKWTVVGVRVDSRKVPSKVIKAHVDLKVQSLMKERDLAFVGKEAIRSLEDEVRSELIRKQTPTMKMIEIAWERKTGVILASASTSSAQGILGGLLTKHFGLEMKPLLPLYLAAMVAPEVHTNALMGLEPVRLEETA